MNRLVFLFFTCLINLTAFATDTATLHETGRKYLYSGDIDNAVLVLNRAMLQHSENIEIQHDLQYAYHLKKDYSNAVMLGKKTLALSDSNEVTYQLLGMSYKQIAAYSECEKLYKKALKKLPNSGTIYNEFGELYAMQEKFDKAIRYWEKGIEKDPCYGNNYYNAALYYNENSDYLWAVLYGEIFVNIESFTNKTASIKQIILNNYKLLFSSPTALPKAAQKGTAFSKTVAAILLKHASITYTGINTASLTDIRTHFIVDWYEQTAPLQYRLFDHHRQLLLDKTFNGYNQWLFTSVADPAAYNAWISANTVENNKLKNLMENRVFKIPEKQYYKL